MKLIKKQIIFFILILFSSLTAVPIGLSLPDSVIYEGDYINYPVIVDSVLTGEEIFSYQLQLKFNNTFLSFEEIIKTSTLSSECFVDGSEYAAGKIKIAAASAQALIGSGELILLRFKAIKAGSSYLQFDGSENNYFNEGSPEMITDNGSIIVQIIPTLNISPATAILAVGDEKQFYASAGTAPYTWSVDNSEFASITSEGKLKALKKGIVKVLAEDIEGVSGVSGEIEIRGFKVWIEDNTAYTNMEIMIPIFTTDLSGLEIVSGQLTINFYHNSFEATEIVTEGTVLEGHGDIHLYSPATNVAKISFAGTENLSGEGILFYLKGRIRSSTSFTFSDLLFNEDLYGVATSGYYTAQELPNLNISYNNDILYPDMTKQFIVTNGIEPYNWSVSDTSRAVIDENGLLTAKKGGSIRVFVTDFLTAFGESSDIEIFDFDLSLPDLAGQTGTILEYPVSIDVLTEGVSFNSFEISISYDTSKIHLSGDIIPAEQTENWFLDANEVGSELIIVGAGNDMITDEGILCTLPLLISPNLTSNTYANINIEESLFDEGYPIAYHQNGTISIELGLEKENKVITHLLTSTYPNPFNSTTVINYYLPNSSEISLLVYDSKGQIVSVLAENKIMDKGNYRLNWSAEKRSIVSGIYFYLLTAKEIESGKVLRNYGKMVLVK